MSNKCPHCGAIAGKSHDPCPFAPGGKKYKAPAQKRPLPASRVFVDGVLADSKTVEIVDAPIDAVIHEAAPRERPRPTPEGRKAKAATLQAMAEGVKVKAPRSQSRAGKKAATIWLMPEEMKRLQRASLNYEVPQERILAEGLALMLGDKYKV